MNEYFWKCYLAGVLLLCVHVLGLVGLLPLAALQQQVATHSGGQLAQAGLGCGAAGLQAGRDGDGRGLRGQTSLLTLGQPLGGLVQQPLQAQLGLGSGHGRVHLFIRGDNVMSRAFT